MAGRAYASAGYKLVGWEANGQKGPKGDGSGGNQSFATGFLSEEKNGVIISSMYSRDHVSVFAKPIKNFISEQGELTAEEKDALNHAKDSIKLTPR